MRLIITRHGETVENQLGITQGQSTQGRLSESGMEQGKKLAERLKDEKIDYIYSSDLARASDTAKMIAKYHPDTPIEFVKELKEWSRGEIEGKRAEETGWHKLIKEFKKDINKKPKGGESLQDLYKRAEKFLHQILQKHKGENVLLVAHNTVSKAIICAITGRPVSDIVGTENLKNTSVTVFEIDEDMNHKTCVFNCTKHLD